MTAVPNADTGASDPQMAVAAPTASTATENHFDLDLDLTVRSRIHIIGVGGAGMRAIASVLAAMGHAVSGSDLKESSGLDRLRAEGVEVTIGHDAENVVGADLVTRSTAVPDLNSEVVAARAAGTPVLSRAEILAAIARIRPTLAVAGTHGKTTTSSMLALALVEAEMDPSFIIGGEVNEIGSGAVWSDEPGWFVVEADESDGTFLELERSAAIVTSLEPDHLSHYGSQDALEAAFGAFVAGVTGPVVMCLDDLGCRRLIESMPDAEVISYGTAQGADWLISGYEPARAGASFDLRGPGLEQTTLRLATPGIHNVRNATAAIAAAVAIGAPVSAAIAALERFGGVARRFQFRGVAQGVTYVDDYAHLPSEVDAALEAAAGGDWDRIVCVFQPHRYSRTADLWQDFAASFHRADLVVFTDVYAAGEAAIPGVTGKLVADAVLDADPRSDVAYLPHREDLRLYLRARLRPGDLCITLGAGDLTTLPDELLGVHP
jgi:UDP-N-acetylmuramate--alanine ligase